MTAEQLANLSKKEVGNAVKRLRVSKSLTQQELADRTNTQKWWICEVENGKVNFCIEKLARVLEEFNMSLKELYDSELAAI